VSTNPRSAEVINLYPKGATDHSIKLGKTMAVRAFRFARIAKLPLDCRQAGEYGERYRCKWASLLFNIRRLKATDKIAYVVFKDYFNLLARKEKVN
jgi:hypothetical protein